MVWKEKNPIVDWDMSMRVRVAESMANDVIWN